MALIVLCSADFFGVHASGSRANWNQWLDPKA